MAIPLLLIRIGNAAAAAGDLPDQSGVDNAGRLLFANNIDPILAVKPDGSHIRALRRMRAGIRRRLRE